MADFDIHIGPHLVTIDLPAETEISLSYQYQKKDKSNARPHVWFGEREYDGAQGVMDITDSPLGQLLTKAYGSELQRPA